MEPSKEIEPSKTKDRATVERRSDRELVVTRLFNAPPRLVFDTWTKPELFKQWWFPMSFGLSVLSCEMDIREGGSYRILIKHGDAEMPFFGKYTEVTPHSRLVWTNEEGDGLVVTTVTFEEKAGKTLLVVHELHPSKEALDAARASGVEAGMPETHAQLDELLATLQRDNQRS